VESRLANPAAECPRCGATSPPTDAPLLTCAACGLTFQPHELQRPHRPNTLPDPPPGLRVARRPDAVIARWDLEWWIGLFFALSAIAMLIGTAVILNAFGIGIATGALALFTAAYSYLAAVFTFNHVELAITHDALIHRIRPLRLLDSHRIPRAGLRAVRQQFEPAERQRPARHVVLVAGDGTWQQVLATRRADHARYLAQLIADACDLAAR